MEIRHEHTIDTPHTQKYLLFEGENKLSWREVITLWAENEDFRAYFLRLLGNSPFEAFFWETPPLTRETLDQDFEFVLIDSPALAKVQPEIQAFGGYFGQSSSYPGVAAFPNLGGDAFLVVPEPQMAETAYSHIANFVRNAPFDQQHTFWQCVAAQITHRLSSRKLWVSTSGLGVYWLHVRLDSRPKYYQHLPYKT